MKPAKTKRIIMTLSMICILISLSGCSNRQKSKQEVISHWDNARNNIALDLAGKQMENGQLDTAIRTLEDTLKNYPDLVDGWLLLAQVYQQKDMPIMSTNCLEKALSIKPNHSEANYQMGMIKEISGDTTAALECYQKAAKQSPDNLEYVLAEAQLLMETGNISEAEQKLQKQMQLGRNSLELLMTTGNLYLMEDRLPEAISMFTAAYQKAPQSKLAADRLCFTLMKDRQFSLAAEQIEQIRVSQGRDKDNNLTLALGDCYLYTDRYIMAQRCYETILRDDGPKVEYYIRLAQASLGRGDYTRTESSCQKALQLQSDNEEAATLLAVAYLKQNKLTDCIDTIKAVLDYNPQSSLAWCIKGKAYSNLGNTQKAYEML